MSEVEDTADVLEAAVASANDIESRVYDSDTIVFEVRLFPNSKAEESETSGILESGDVGCGRRRQGRKASSAASSNKSKALRGGLPGREGSAITPLCSRLRF